jgi:hypothetical protein
VGRCGLDGCEGERAGGSAKFFSATLINEGKAGAAKYAVAIDDAGNRDALIQHLRDGKVTLRASVYRNWFHARLMPWVHFVPLDNTFVDLYGVMEYFFDNEVGEEKEFGHAVGEVQGHEHHFHTPEDQDTSSSTEKKARRSSKCEGHDEAAQRIAAAGKEWADKVLRKEDALIYTCRLLLEYARVLDDKRDRLGWFDDLK